MQLSQFLSQMEGFIAQIRKLYQIKPRRLVSVMGILVSILLVLHSFTLSPGMVLSPRFPSFQNPVSEQEDFPRKFTSPKSIKTGKLSFQSGSMNNDNPSLILEKVENANISDMGEFDLDYIIQEPYGDSEKSDDSNDDIDLSVDSTISVKIRDINVQKNASEQLVTEEMVVSLKHILMPQKVRMPIDEAASMSYNASMMDQPLLLEKIITSNGKSVSRQPALVQEVNIPSIISSSGENATIASSTSLLRNETLVSLAINLTASSLPLKTRMSPISVLEMNHLLIRNHASNQSLRLKKYSSHEKQMLAALAQMENSPTVKNDHELYAPVFRNISMFKRSYELMEHTLKVYVYRDGRKPIFHQPLLKGIYASEGWFMKLMETNRHYVVKDPRKAHLFYMPFSSRLLQFALYVPNSHKYGNLEQYLRNYTNTIASKYPFWNRTGGADHFLAACHDWAPRETREAMKNSIRALCNADLGEGFQIGKDVSLPEIYIRSARNPLRDLGGMPATERPTLAFFAGNVHGRLRPILLKYWEGKDPDMKISGPMLPGVERKMIYINHMKTSKYCICPRGFEVNSPRVVESIYYECVPVIISDDFVPPFFEVLNWEAFSVIIPEVDVSRLKEILLSVPEERYVLLQKGVKRVQQHFMWHSNPVKYDLFNMILHSIWFNRLHQIRIR